MTAARVLLIVLVVLFLAASARSCSQGDDSVGPPDRSGWTDAIGGILVGRLGTGDLTPVPACLDAGALAPRPSCTITVGSSWRSRKLVVRALAGTTRISVRSEDKDVPDLPAVDVAAGGATNDVTFLPGGGTATLACLTPTTPCRLQVL